MSEKIDNVDSNWFRAKIDKRDLKNLSKKVILKVFSILFYISYFFSFLVIWQSQHGEHGGHFYGYGYTAFSLQLVTQSGMSVGIEQLLNRKFIMIFFIKLAPL